MIKLDRNGSLLRVRTHVKRALSTGVHRSWVNINMFSAHRRNGGRTLRTGVHGGTFTTNKQNLVYTSDYSCPSQSLWTICLNYHISQSGGEGNPREKMKYKKLPCSRVQCTRRRVDRSTTSGDGVKWLRAPWSHIWFRQSLVNDYIITVIISVSPCCDTRSLAHIAMPITDQIESLNECILLPGLAHLVWTHKSIACTSIANTILPKREYQFR